MSDQDPETVGVSKKEPNLPPEKLPFPCDSDGRARSDIEWDMRIRVLREADQD